MQTLDGETIETLAPARRLQGNAARELPGACRVIEKMDDFRALDPFFRVIEHGLAGFVDGEHFFDMLADDVVFDFVIIVPDYPRHVVGRDNLLELTIRRQRRRSCSNNPPEAKSSPPATRTGTDTSPWSPSRTAKSPTGATT